MKVAFFTEGMVGFDDLFGGLSRALLARGDEVMACYNSSGTLPDERVRPNPCRWHVFDFGCLEDFKPDKIVIFNSRHVLSLAATTWLVAKYGRGVILHAELGWLPQCGNIYLDRSGCGGWSDLRKIGMGSVPQNPRPPHLNGLYAVNTLPDYIPKEFILVPLQLEYDTSILYDSTIFKTMASLVGFVKKSFPDYPIVVRQHPKHKIEVSLPDIVLVDEGISTRDLSAKAKAIVGINSTSLIEGLVLGTPVLALGENVASDKGVFYEGEIAFLSPRGVLTWSPAIEIVDSVLALLCANQFPAHAPPPEVLENYF